MSYETILVPVRALCEACADCDRLSIEGQTEYDVNTKTNNAVWACKRLEFCQDVRSTLIAAQMKQENEDREA